MIERLRICDKAFAIKTVARRTFFLFAWITFNSVISLAHAENTINPVPETKVNATISILVLGDSLSAAYRLPPEQGWVALVERRSQTLQAEHDAEQPAPHIDSQWVNASVSGATTAAGLARLPRLLETHAPDIVIIELGANDGLQGKPIPYITRNLSKLITTAQSSGAHVVLVGVQLPPNFGQRYTKPFFEQFSVLAEKYALTQIPFLLEGVGGHQHLMMSDGLHPNAEGQKRIAEYSWPIIYQTIVDTAKRKHQAAND